MALWKHHTTRQIQYKEMKSILGGGAYWVTTAVEMPACFFAQGCEKMEKAGRVNYITIWVLS